jgi:hypothetical protein
MNHRTLAVVNFKIRPWLADRFLASVQFGSSGTWDTAGDAWDLVIELVLSDHKRQSFSLGKGTVADPFRPGPLPESNLAFVEFVSKEAPHHELSVGKRFDIYYGFKPIADVYVINVVGSPIPAGKAGKVRTTRPMKSEFDARTTYPAGTEVVLVESLDNERSEWLVEVACGHSECRVPDETLVGGASYDVVQVVLADTEPVLAASGKEDA